MGWQWKAKIKSRENLFTREEWHVVSNSVCKESIFSEWEELHKLKFSGSVKIICRSELSYGVWKENEWGN